MISKIPSKYFVATLEVIKPLSVIIASCLFIYFVYFSPYFAITHTLCLENNNDPCQNDFVVSELESSHHSNLFRYFDTQLKTRLLQADPTINTLTLTKILPHTLKLQIDSSNSVVALTVGDSNQYFILDQDYRVLAITPKDPNLPLLTLDNPLTLLVGQQIDDPTLLRNLSTALTIAQSIPGASRFVVGGESLSTQLKSGKTAVFTTRRDLSDQITALQTLLLDATISNHTYFDVRYAQPVLKPE